MQYHSQRTSGRYYNVRPARRDALVAKEIVQLIFGAEIDYPTQDEINQELEKEWIQELQHLHKKPARAKGMTNKGMTNGAQPKDHRSCYEQGTRRAQSKSR